MKGVSLMLYTADIFAISHRRIGGNLSEKSMYYNVNSRSAVFDELSRYPSSIDTGSQVFSDFLKLSENSVIFPYNLDTYRTDIIGYQNGTLTLDEAVEERTRVVNIMLNE